MDIYAGLVGGSVTGEAELVEDDMRALVLADVPPFTVAVRMKTGPP